MADLVAVRLLDSPIGPQAPRFSMRAPLPDKLRVAFHRQAVGVWDSASAAAFGHEPQASLWLTLDYVLVEEVDLRKHWYGIAREGRYHVAVGCALGLTEADLAPFARRSGHFSGPLEVS